MFQTLIVIASIVVLASAILTSSLVSAKNAFQQVVAAKTQTAMTDATSQFTAWAQNIIANQGGTEQNWAGAVNPVIPTKPMCSALGPCQFYETTTWIVTGSTSGKAAAQIQGQTASTVQNMAPAVDEQRLSATINVAISDVAGHTIYGGRSNEVTARILNTSPYVVITAVHDLQSNSGNVNSSEGDSGGQQQKQAFTVQAVPLPTTLFPNGYTDTVIRTTIDCENNIGFNESQPTAKVDQGNGRVRQLRQGGSLSWSFQLPCTPTYGVPTAPPSASNYIAPRGTVYEIGASSASTTWRKGDQNNGFPK